MKRRHYIRDLSSIVVMLRNRANDLGMDWPEVAMESDLCAITVERLFLRQTDQPRFKTVWAVAWTLGFEIAMDGRQGFIMTKVA